MSTTTVIDLAQVATSLGLPPARVETVVELLDDGNTVPFITRYRKDQTGGLDEEQIREIQSRVVKLRLLAERKQTILRSIDSQGRLTPLLAAAIEAATSTRQLEDLYLPFKPRKQTLATAAREHGLEPLALEILEAEPAALDLDQRAADFINTDKKVASAADALLGAGHILAEVFSERADLRGRLRTIFERSGKLVSAGVEPETKKTAEAAAAQAPATQEAPAAETPAAEATETPSPLAGEGRGEGEALPETHATGSTEAVATIEAPAAEAPGASTPPPGKRDKQALKAERQAAKKKKKELLLKAFRDYYEFREALGKIPPHRILAINRGEKLRALRVRIEADLEAMTRVVDEMLVPAEHPHADFLRGCARDALMRLILPSLEREVRREMTDWAELHAVQVFARNLRCLLLQPPVSERRVLAMDPGFRSGCKVVALDEFGNLLDQAVVHLVGKEERRTEAKAKVIELIKQHQTSVVAIGNGTGCRETEQWVSDLISSDLSGDNAPVPGGVSYVIVNEAGASVYSTSRIGREELPSYDATLRGAISIGRRLQDPLSELVKIDPASIGVGLYQHDVKAKHLRDSLDAVVESCVNYVGVDLNTASPALLRYVSGLNQLTAQRLYDYRLANGPFRSREQLKSVTGFGESTFVQAAGFLKIAGGDCPLDATWIHPESYPLTERVLSKLEASPADLAEKPRVAELAERTAKLDVGPLVSELGAGELTLRDIVAQLARPGRDPRESLPPPIFKKGILKMDDLTPGLELAGTILNVVDFGAFVDIGLKDSGLVHISQLADKYVQDPHEVVSVGDIVKVWVMEVDKQRRRVSLTMIQPGSKREAPPRRPARPEGSGRPQGAGQQQGTGQQQGGRPPRPQRPPQTGGGPPPKKGKFPPRRDQQQQYQQPKPKPKPVVPLTKAMKEGKAPLRTFGDLKQFIDLKQEEPKDAEKKE